MATAKLKTSGIEMKKINKILMAGLPLLLVGGVQASDSDVTALDTKVNEKVTQIEETGLLPTSVEIEVIMGDIVVQEVQETDLTTDEAINKYQLTPTLERYIKIKEASQVLRLGVGAVVIPPDPPG
jgi:hypothetical protein